VEGRGEDHEGATTSDPRAAGATNHKRHLTFGLIWVAMGIFLVVSTLVNVPR
jgi:hypothetical protein